jgi:hypothetical protein
MIKLISSKISSQCRPLFKALVEPHLKPLSNTIHDQCRTKFMTNVEHDSWPMSNTIHEQCRTKFKAFVEHNWNPLCRTSFPSIVGQCCQEEHSSTAISAVYRCRRRLVSPLRLWEAKTKDRSLHTCTRSRWRPEMQSDTSRVTRLADFLLFGLLFRCFGQFCLKIQQTRCSYFFYKNVMYKIWQNMGCTAFWEYFHINILSPWMQGASFRALGVEEPVWQRLENYFSVQF